MKKILKYISVFSVAAMIVGCTTDLEQVVYDPANATAAVFEGLESSYTLSVDTPNDVAITIKWSEPDFGYSASATNNLEFDVEGNSFANALTLTSINQGGEWSSTHSEFNSSVMKILDVYGMDYVTATFELRVASSISTAAESLYSDVATITVTPYVGTKSYPSIAIRGDYNGWDFDNSQKLYSANEDDTYEGMIFFNGAAANGWKLCEDSGWANNWGLSGGESAEASSFTMSSGGDNISIYSLNSYYFTFNYSTLELSMSKAHSSWGVVGSHNDWGGSADNDMTLINIDNTFYLKAVVDFAAGDEWKIRPDNTWTDDVGCSAVSVDSQYTTDYGNFTIPTAGTYTIRWYFNGVEQVVEVLEGDVADESTDGGDDDGGDDGGDDDGGDLGVGDDDAVDTDYTGPDNSAYNSITLRGDYNGWDFTAAQRLFSAANDTSYGAMVYLDGKGSNGWKLCEDADWTTSWGLSGGEENEASSFTMTSDNGGNITIYSLNSYYFTFDTSTSEFTMSNPYSSWGVVGAYNDWGGSTDTAMTLACRDNVYYLTATISFTAGSEWKIRPDNMWENDLGCWAVTVDSSYTTDGGNFIIPEDGIYTIRWYFNSVTQEVRVIKHTEE